MRGSRVSQACVVGHSSADFLGVLPAYLAGGGVCERVYTLSYFSHGAAARLASRVEPGGTLAFLGHAHVLARSAAGEAEAAGVRVVGVVSWRSAVERLEAWGVEARTVQLPWYYRVMSGAVKGRVEVAARLLDALSESKAELARAIQGFMGELAEYAASAGEEVDPDSLGLMAARTLESRLPLRPREAAGMAVGMLAPWRILELGEVGVEVYMARLPSPKAVVLLKVVARELLKRAGDGVRAVIVVAPGKAWYWLAGVARAEASWMLGVVARAYKLVGDTEGLVETPTAIEGPVVPGARLLAAASVAGVER